MTISVITPTYNTAPQTLARTWASLKAQTYTDWQWVVYDDSTDDRVWRQLWGICADERYRVLPLRGMANDGSIGRVKRRAFMAAEGDLLVELDHDDELTPDCLQEVHDEWQRGSQFIYSDWSEVLPDGQTGRYPEGWAFGYGSEYLDQTYGWVMKAPPVNEVTIRHIVSAPNHVRAWDASLYRSLNGHDASLEVADDYDLIVRTALEVKPGYVPKMLYRQHISPNTAQRVRNRAIQEHVARIAAKYDSAITQATGTTILEKE